MDRSNSRSLPSSIDPQPVTRLTVNGVHHPATTATWDPETGAVEFAGDTEGLQETRTYVVTADLEDGRRVWLAGSFTSARLVPHNGELRVSP